MHPEQTKHEIFINKQNIVDAISIQDLREEVLPILFTLQVLGGSSSLSHDERVLLDEIIVRLRRLVEGGL